MTGSLTLVSVGPGFADHITDAARAAIRNAEVVVAYDLYLTWIRDWLAEKELVTLPLTQEKARANAALVAARQGRKVVLISSGDIGVYGMASLVFEDMSEDEPFDISVVPGVTAATACASLLGAPLSHDFATLSLSDLLCPWGWIETRAEHIAQADLCVALYNVQSKTRQDGIYRILNILAKQKNSNTVCGIVRNAYRAEQTVQVTSLVELLGMSFDMLTTLIIGNRHTLKKGNWMFTPRGYNSWTASESERTEDLHVASESENTLDINTAPPKDAIWIFSGTSDGNSLTNRFLSQGNRVVVSTATEYGAQVAQENCPGAHVVFGKIGAAIRKERLLTTAARAIVDATHPYAKQMSLQLLQIAGETAIPYIRYERPMIVNKNADRLECVADAMEAAQSAIQRGTRIFLATGSKDLKTFLSALNGGEIEWFVRLSADPDFTKQAIELGVRPDHIIAMQGPWSKEFNLALWRHWKIDCLVTKESGEAGGYGAKLEAANELKIPIIVIKRPHIAYQCVASDFEDAVEYLKVKGVCK
ncbi:hypothetical protein BH10CYA1_BH10CYA1_48050 [soil metagenome]